jgi:hypothetical protein
MYVLRMAKYGLYDQVKVKLFLSFKEINDSRINGFKWYFIFCIYERPKGEFKGKVLIDFLKMVFKQDFVMKKRRETFLNKWLTFHTQLMICYTY